MTKALYESGLWQSVGRYGDARSGLFAVIPGYGWIISCW